MTRQVIAIGGGGFLSGTEPGLDLYVLAQSAAARPAIGFVPTASGDARDFIVKFYARYAPLDCQPSHLELFGRTPDLLQWAMAQDVIYVGGGNTKSMLAVWRAWGLPEILRRAMANGTVLAGVSAGALCWFEQGITDSDAGIMQPIDGLGFLPGVCCPHYSAEAQRQPVFERQVGAGPAGSGIAIDDGAAVHYVDGQVFRTIAGRDGAQAYLAARGAGSVHLAPCDMLLASEA